MKSESRKMNELVLRLFCIETLFSCRRAAGFRKESANIKYYE